MTSVTHLHREENKNKEAKKDSFMGDAVSARDILKEKNKIIQELTDLIETISRGKYMWESTFDAITDPVIIISGDYTIQRANRAAARVGKIDVRHMNGTLCYESLAGFTTPCQGCPLETTLNEERVHEGDLNPFQKSRRQFHANAYPLTSEPHQGQAVLHYRDITEERELQHKLIHSEKIAAIGTLAGGVAHEINNPLGGILAFTQLIMRDLGQEHANFGDLKEIEEATLRCKRIVQDLLDFSRQNREESMVPVHLNDIIKKVIPLVQVQAKASRIALETDLAPHLPMIRGNSHKLQQVFLNLITNAYQSMTKGGRLMLKTLLNRSTGMVEGLVIDTGEGIKPEHVDKIFDPYFTTKDHGQGTGLGLSITYGIVQEHGGTIKVTSMQGGGSTFIISLPQVEQGG